MTDPIGTFAVFFTGAVGLFVFFWWFGGRRGEG